MNEETPATLVSMRGFSLWLRFHSGQAGASPTTVLPSLTLAWLCNGPG